jgi:hypothetical protein
MSKRVCAAALFALFAPFVAAGCDLVAMDGQTLVASGRGSVYGSGGNALQPPVSAVRVMPGGTLIVQDADMYGGGILVESVDQPLYGVAASGILADASLDPGRPAPRVRVVNGLVQGGSVVLQVPVNSYDAPGAALDVFGADLEISGGLMRGGGLVSTVPGDTLLPDLAGAALFAQDSAIRVTGGTFELGTVSPLDPTAGVATSPTFIALDSDVEIRAGEFNEGILLEDGSARIFGGRARMLVLTSPTQQGCSELRGGSFALLGVVDTEVRVFGTELALSANGATSRLLGRLEDGSPLRMDVLQIGSGRVTLVSPGSPGCP